MRTLSVKKPITAFMKGEVKHKLSLDRPARENAERPACIRIHRRIAIANQVRLQPDRLVLTGSLFKERILAADAVSTAFVGAAQTRFVIEPLIISRNCVVTCQRRPS